MTATTVDVIPYLSMLNSKLTSYDLRRVANLNSMHSFRLFELMMQFKSTGVLIIEVEKLRLLDLGDSYKRFNNLRQRVIAPSINEIMAKSGITITYQTITEGKTVKESDVSIPGSETNATCPWVMGWRSDSAERMIFDR